MASLENGRKTVLGNLNNYLKETLEYIVNKGKITAKEFSVIRQLEANTSGTRLLNLHKKRLVKRIDEKKNGGRVWVYEILKGG
jgi:predicted HTH transcriptional regulator